MVHQVGFEPATPRFVVWCSIQLSYWCTLGRKLCIGRDKGKPSARLLCKELPHPPQKVGNPTFTTGNSRPGCALPDGGKRLIVKKGRIGA
jgi:hypothetical protein